jgi:hypothetical protein
MHYKFHEPHPAITNLIINKHGEEKENRMCYPSDQFYLPVNDALNLQIRYPERGISSSLIVANRTNDSIKKTHKKIISLQRNGWCLREEFGAVPRKKSLRLLALQGKYHGRQYYQRN